jgi:oligopeptide transport system permease protein
MSTTLIYAVLIALSNLSVDILYVFLDPRIRLD